MWHFVVWFCRRFHVYFIREKQLIDEVFAAYRAGVDPLETLVNKMKEETSSGLKKKFILFVADSCLLVAFDFAYKYLKHSIWFCLKIFKTCFMLSAVLVSCGFLFILTETTNAWRQDEVGISYKRFHTSIFYYLYKDINISLKKKWII